MIIHEEVKSEIVIISLSGSMIGGPEENVLVNKVERNTDAQNYMGFVINLEKTNHIDLNGLKTLQTCLAAAKNANHELKLSHVAKKIKRPIRNKLKKIFEIYPTKEAAINSFDNL